MDSIRFDKMKETLTEMSLSDLRWLIREALATLFDKLKDEEDFGSTQYIHGTLESHWPDVYVVDIQCMSSGDTRDSYIYKI